MTIAHPEKFQNAVGSLTYTFDLHGMEWESEQELTTPLSRAVGSSYSHDHLGYAESPAGDGTESVRTIIVGADTAAAEAALDSARATCRRIGRGRLYLVLSDGSRRWCEARLASAPTIRVEPGQSRHIPTAMEFVRLSDWFSTDQETGSHTVDSASETFTINNPGNIAARWVLFRLRSNGGAGSMTNASVANGANGMSFSTTRDFSAAGHELRVNTRTYAVEYSTDDGASYANDYSLFSTPAEQVGVMRLEPGDNEITVTDGGTPDYDLEWAFYPPFA